MLQKNIFIVGGAVAVAVAVGGYFLFFKGQSPTEEAMETAFEDGSYSLRDLLGANERMRCTFTYEDEEVRSSGVVYTAPNVIRVDSESTTTFNNTTVNASSIIDTEYVYAWMQGSSDGYRIAVADMDAAAANTESPAPDYDQRHEYDCEEWSADESVFQPPANVTFMDPMEMLQGMMPGSGASGEAGASADMGAQMCAMCEQAGDASARAQCKAALGCE